MFMVIETLNRKVNLQGLFWNHQFHGTWSYKAYSKGILWLHFSLIS